MRKNTVKIQADSLFKQMRKELIKQLREGALRTRVLYVADSEDNENKKMMREGVRNISGVHVWEVRLSQALAVVLIERFSKIHAIATNLRFVSYVEEVKFVSEYVPEPFVVGINDKSFGMGYLELIPPKREREVLKAFDEMRASKGRMEKLLETEESFLVSEDGEVIFYKNDDNRLQATKVFENYLPLRFPEEEAVKSTKLEMFGKKRKFQLYSGSPFCKMGVFFGEEFLVL